ncbi:MAG: chorismate-binding protein, partial [Candidatus Magnetominusculus sp. LBB02]|nr:chorismate-binding protein [Candidatus Magnetominusculus sp. LBB02]
MENQINPGIDAFEADCNRSGRVPPLYREIPYGRPADYYEALKGKNSFLLESIKGPYNIARYSYIGLDPYLTLRAQDGAVEVESMSCELPGRGVSFKSPLVRLRELVAAYPQRPAQGLPPFQGGACGLMSYDFVRYFEKIPNAALDDLRLPVAHFFMNDRLLAFDHKEKKAWIVLCPGARASKLGFNSIAPNWRQYYSEAADMINHYYGIINDVKQSAPLDLKPQAAFDKSGIESLSNMSKAQYMEIVRRTLEYIRAGDIFQANLSQRLALETGGLSPWAIYRALSAINPSPFACYFDFGDYHIVSSSPERLVSVETKQDSG